MILIGGAAGSELAHLPIETVHANSRQPRRKFDSEAAAGLAESVSAQGVVQPVLVRPREAGGYELIAGERRWRAARDAGLPTEPAVIRDADDRDSILLGLVVPAELPATATVSNGSPTARRFTSRLKRRLTSRSGRFPSKAAK